MIVLMSIFWLAAHTTSKHLTVLLSAALSEGTGMIEDTTSTVVNGWGAGGRHESLNRLLLLLLLLQGLMEGSSS